MVQSPRRLGAGGKSTPPTPHSAVISFVKDHWYHIAGTAGELALAGFAAWLGVWFSQPQHTGHWYLAPPVVCLALSMVITAVSRYASWSDLPGIGRLQAEKEDLQRRLDAVASDYDAFFDLVVRAMSTAATLTHSERVSLFRHDSDHFVLVARHSNNPEYKRRGRPSYPEREGCLAKAWAAGEAHVTVVADPVNNTAGYLQELETKHNVPNEVGGKLTMKSVVLDAYALRDRLGDHTAVVVFESVRRRSKGHADRSRGQSPPELAKLKESVESYGSVITGLLETLKPTQPALEDARREGV